MQRIWGQVRCDGGEAGQVRPGLGEGGEEEGNRDKVMKSLRHKSLGCCFISQNSQSLKQIFCLFRYCVITLNQQNISCHKLNRNNKLSNLKLPITAHSLPAQTHNSVFCDSESCAPVLFQIPQITKFVKQQMCWRKYSQEVFVLLSGQGPQVATRSVSYFLKLFRTMNNTLND